MRHRNIVAYIDALIRVDNLKENNTVLQFVRCSFDAHMQDIAGAFCVGATLVLLHPDGNLDLDYLVETILHKKITYMIAVPSLIKNLCDFIDHKKVSYLKTIRTLIFGGQ